jgi:hypothetical protein
MCRRPAAIHVPPGARCAAGCSPLGTALHAVPSRYTRRMLATRQIRIVCNEFTAQGAVLAPNADVQPDDLMHLCSLMT